MRDRKDVHPGGRVLAAVLSGLLATSAMAPYAFAQPKAPAAEAGKNMTAKQKRDAARKHYGAGKDKLDAKDYAGALVEFQAANALIPSPQAQQKIALCYDGMNDAPNAIKAYELFIEQAAAKASLATDVEDAKKRIEALKNAPVPVKVVSDPASAQVEVDGEAQMGVTPLEIKLTPGMHKVKVTAPGFDSIEKEVEVTAGGEMQNLSFSLPQSAEAVAAAAPPVAPPPTEPPPSEDQGAEQRSNLPAYITLGVAGAAAIVGTGFGIKALSEKGEFDDFATTDRADDTERYALISDMAFGVAVTLGVTGTVLLLSNHGESDEQAAKDERNKRTMKLTPYVGPSGGGAAATWRF